MGRHRLQQATIVPIVLFPGTTVVQYLAGNIKRIVTAGDDMAVMVNGVVAQVRGGGLVWTGMGWLWFPRGERGRKK